MQPSDQKAPMPRGETLRKFLASLMLHGFYGSAIMRMEAGKVMHVETEKRRIWQYKDLPRRCPSQDAQHLSSGDHGLLWLVRRDRPNGRQSPEGPVQGR